MDKARLRRLEAAGWKLGSVQDFLDLIDEEAEYVELKANLASRLQQARQQRGLTQSSAARLLHASQSRVAKMEAGDRTVSVDLMFRALFRLGVSLSDVMRVPSPATAAALKRAPTTKAQAGSAGPSLREPSRHSSAHPTKAV